MEFASEVVIKATLLCENIVQHRDPVSRARDRPLSVDAKLDWPLCRASLVGDADLALRSARVRRGADLLVDPSSHFGNY